MDKAVIVRWRLCPDGEEGTRYETTDGWLGCWGDGACGPLIGRVGSCHRATKLQRLAEAQTQLLLSHLKMPLGAQTASPMRCNEGQDAAGTNGTFLLPTFAGKAGNRTFNCRVKARAVLVDLGGVMAIEDARFDSGSSYTFYEDPPPAVPVPVAFTKANLERICDDMVSRPDFFPSIPLPARPATLDGTPLSGARAVSTPPFTSRVKKSAGLEYGQLYRDSQNLGHPGKLATTFCGWKARVPLSPGHHVITVNLGDLAGSPTMFTYDIQVRR
jgi:hypothetical protein